MRRQNDLPICIDQRSQPTDRHVQPIQNALTSAVSAPTSIAASFGIRAQTPETWSRTELVGLQDVSAEPFLYHVSMHYTI